MGKQFANLSSKYGAAMGRATFGTPEGNCDPKTVRLFAVKLDSGGYDDGGAYWGSGGTLYCATDNLDYRQFTRARNRTHAALLLDIDPEYLRMPLERLVWGRFSAEKGFFGKAEPGYQVKEFGAIIAHVEDWAALCRFAQKHEK